MLHRRLGRLVPVLLLLLCSLPLFGQVDKASIEAIALDQSKAALPGVTVTVARPETGFQITNVTDANGLARFLALTPGNYQVSFNLEGFAPVKAQKLTIVVGQTAKVAVTMQQRASETITVTAEAPIVDVHKTDASTNILPEQIESLPVADRDFQKLAFIAPGVQRERGGYRFVTGGPVVGSGGNASQTTIMVDGVDFTDPALGLARTRFSQDAIREFRVIQNRFDTEIGGSAGGALSIVTKSGTNDIHGNVFGFFRDKSLRSQGELDLQKNDYSRHQYGLTAGGPAVRDKVFYFASVEQVSENAVTLFRPGGKFASQAADIKQPFDQTLLFGSMDSQFTPSQNGSIHGTYEKYKQENFRVGGVVDTLAGQRLDRDNWNVTGESNGVYGNATTNEARLQFGSRKYEEPLNNRAMAEWFSSGNTLQTGSNILGDLLGSGTEWEVRDTFHHSLTAGKGSHDIKAGFSVMHVSDRSRIETYQQGLMLYLTDDRTLPLAYAYGVGSSDVTADTTLYGVFIEDGWRPSANLAVNLGLRYDLDSNGNHPGYTHPLIPEPRKRDTNNFQPRVSFTYDLTGTGTSVVRGGAGRFTGRFLLVPLFQELSLNGITGRLTYTRLNGALLGFPTLALDPNNPMTTGIPSKASINLMSPTLKSPQADQASFGYTQKLGDSRMFLDAEAIYVKGKNEITIRDTNFGGNANPIRPNTTWNQINMYENLGHSKYTALVLSLNGNIRESDLVTASITYGNKKNISDDFSPDFTTGYPNDPHDMEAEYGRGRSDERYRIVLSSVHRIPWGLTISPIFEFGSGQPWTQRLGYDYNGDSFNSDRAPGVKRNTMNGPEYRSISLRLTKDVPVGMGSLQLIAEAFNLTNFVNYDVQSIQSGMYLAGPTIANPKAAYTVNPRYGQYTATLPPREVQLGVRWVY